MMASSELLMRFSLRICAPKLVMDSLNKAQIVVFLLPQPATLPVKLVLVQVTRTAETVKRVGLKTKKQLV